LKWRSLAPKFSKAVLLEVLPLKEKIIAIYQSNQRPSISVFDYSGNILYNLELPLGSSVNGFDGGPDDEEFLFHMTSYTLLPLVYSFNVRTYERKMTEQTRVSYESGDLEIKELEASGKDGVKIPILLVHKKGMTLNSQNPTILSAYGGFGSVEQPSFDPGIVYFVKKGGIFAFANIRGGGDLGVDWAMAGRGSRKQNSFDDFIACAEFLIEKGYTKPEKLAATGGSNGGLVVAAAAIQRPELFKTVVPVVARL
jgi:prolyl oligopeptidase